MAAVMRPKREEKRTWFAITVGEGLMTLVQSSPANAFACLFLLHPISNQVVHGSGVHHLRFSKFRDGWFLVNVTGAITTRLINAVHWAAAGSWITTPIWVD